MDSESPTYFVVSGLPCSSSSRPLAPPLTPIKRQVASCASARRNQTPMSARAVSVRPSVESDAPDSPPKSLASLASEKPARYSSCPVVNGVAPTSGATGAAVIATGPAAADPIESKPTMKMTSSRIIEQAHQSCPLYRVAGEGWGEGLWLDI